MKTDQEIYKWLDDQIPDPTTDADGSRLYYRGDVFQLLKDFVVFNGEVSPAPEPLPQKSLFEMLVAGEIYIDMRGNATQKRINKLRELLWYAAPNDRVIAMPPFAHFFYIRDGSWYGRDNSENMPTLPIIDPMDIEIPNT